MRGCFGCSVLEGVEDGGDVEVVEVAVVMTVVKVGGFVVVVDEVFEVVVVLVVVTADVFDVVVVVFEVVVVGAFDVVVIGGAEHWLGNLRSVGLRGIHPYWTPFM